MTTEQHTPGPWAATNGKYGWQIHSVPSGKNKSSHWIANIKCESCPAHEEANAKGIAAFPDLLAALEVANKLLGDIPAAKNNPKVAASIQANRAAIAKARGQA